MDSGGTERKRRSPFPQNNKQASLNEVYDFVANICPNDKQFETYAKYFVDHQITKELLHTIGQDDLRRIGVNIIGHQKIILKQIKKFIRPKVNFSIPTSSTSTTSLLLIKLVVTILYLSFATFITALTMVLVQYRVPEQNKYPPLPDIVLDSLPLIPMAFQYAEYILSCLLIIMLLIICVHKHRLIVLRRILCITATTFLMRSVTMFVTSLSVPGEHLECQYFEQKPAADIILMRALEITAGMGLSINGVRTCGDYMFSGHTVMLTVLNYSICEYSPKNFRELHTFTWILNVFGMFFVLAAHEHYTLDVIVAFYVTSRLFLYYHETVKSDGAITGATFFPLFSYLEEDAGAPVTNEYEYPWMPLVRIIESIRMNVSGKEKGE